MEKMLNEYLQFASSTLAEKGETFNLTKLTDEIVDKYENSNITKKLDNEIYVNGRKNLIRRCFNNLIDNSIKYGNNISVQLIKKNNSIQINIDDDGPGIEEKEYANVFKPFYKIDKSRGNPKSSVGLGLSIASDIIRSHGGNIILDKSPIGGLRVKISLPL